MDWKIKMPFSSLKLFDHGVRRRNMHREPDAVVDDAGEEVKNICSRSILPKFWETAQKCFDRIFLLTKSFGRDTPWAFSTRGEEALKTHSPIDPAVHLEVRKEPWSNRFQVRLTFTFHFRRVNAC